MGTLHPLPLEFLPEPGQEEDARLTLLNMLERLELVMRGTHDGIWDWDMRINQVYYSPRWKEMLGYTDAEVPPTFAAWENLIHPDDLPMARQKIQDHLNGRLPQLEMEHRLRHKDGSYRWILTRGTSLCDRSGAPYRMAGSHTDITRRKEIEHALRESQDHLQSLLESATTFVVYRVRIDPTHPLGAQILLVSPSIQEITGVEDPYDFAAWFHGIHPDDRQRALQANRHAVENRLPYNQQVRVFNPKKNDWVWLQTISTPVIDTETNTVYYNGLVLDITREKQTEQALREQVQFESLIASLSAEFINLPPGQVDDGIEKALETIGRANKVDRSYVFLYSEDKTLMCCNYEWCAEGIEPSRERMDEMPTEWLQWSNQLLLDMTVLHIPNTNILPPEAAHEQREFEAQSIQSLIAVPMAYCGEVIGFLGFDSVREPKTWSEESIALLKIVGEIFVNALEHKHAQAIAAGQRQFLELLARGSSFSDTLYALVRTIEEQTPGMLGLILLLDEEDKQHLHIGAAVSLPEEYTRSIEGLTIGPLVGSCGTAAYTGQRVIVEDIATDPRWENLRDLGLKYGLRACWSEPVLANDGHVMGTFAMYYRHPRSPSPNELQTIQTAAHLAGIAIEQRRAQKALQESYQTLKQRVMERTREIERRQHVAEGLRDILTILNSDLPSDQILAFIVEQSRQLQGAATCVLHRIDEAAHFVQIEASAGLPDMLKSIKGFPLFSAPSADRSILNRQPVIAREFLRMQQTHEQEAPAQNEEIRRWRTITREQYGSFLAVPLIVKDSVYGSLAFYFHEPRDFSTDEIHLASTLAEHTALAIENARLRVQAEQNAVVAERSRLARDLHDAVTQTLFSTSLIADVLPRIWERNPEDGRRKLEDIRQLTRGALAEMRALLLELRPAALTETSLGELLRQLCEAFSSRAQIPVNLKAEGECPIPPEVQIGLFRIAQEALNNIAKHAHASQVNVLLHCTEHYVSLHVEDNGRGFNPENIPAGHLGLGIIRERTANLQAELTIESEPGEGTCIHVRWYRPAPC